MGAGPALSTFQAVLQLLSCRLGPCRSSGAMQAQSHLVRCNAGLPAPLPRLFNGCAAPNQPPQRQSPPAACPCQ